MIAPSDRHLRGLIDRREGLSPRRRYPAVSMMQAVEHVIYRMRSADDVAPDAVATDVSAVATTAAAAKRRI